MFKYIVYFTTRLLTLGKDSETLIKRLDEAKLSEERLMHLNNGIRKVIVLFAANYLVSISKILMTESKFNTHAYGKYVFLGVITFAVILYFYLKFSYSDEKMYELVTDELRKNGDTNKSDFFLGLFLAILPNILLLLNFLF